MSERYPFPRRVDENGFVRTREGIIICFFMRRTHGEVAPAVWRALEAYRRHIPPDALAWYPTPDSEECEWDALDEEGWKYIGRRMLEWQCPFGCSVDLQQFCTMEVSTYAFEYYGSWLDAPLWANSESMASAVAFRLPTEYLLEHGPGRVRELALELGRELPFSFGYASFVLLDTDQSRLTMRELSARFLGLDLYNLGTTCCLIGTRARGAYWLTFLGQPLLGELGGLERLRKALPFPDVSCLEMEGDRALITLGEWPELIDIQQPVSVPHLRALARLLEPYLYEELTGWFSIDPNAMNRWLRRLCF